jgi:hypothetical protein
MVFTRSQELQVKDIEVFEIMDETTSPLDPVFENRRKVFSGAQIVRLSASFGSSSQIHSFGKTAQYPGMDIWIEGRKEGCCSALLFRDRTS